MESSHLSARSSGWKNSIIKKGDADSRILKRGDADSRLISEAKQFPSKFSPSKNIEAPLKTLGKSGILSYSQDEIKVGEEKGRSGSKDSRLAKRFTAETPKSRPEGQLKLTFKHIPSDKSLDALVLSPRKSKKNDREAVQYLHEIKLEYVRFKDRVMKELKKLQCDIRAAIEEVMAAVQQLRPMSVPKTKAPSFESRIPSVATPTFDSPVAITNKLPTPQIPQGLSVDTSKYRDLLQSQSGLQSVIPQVRDKMSNLFELMGQLKSQINEQALYSPVAARRGVL